MGTSSPDRLTTRFHEVGFWSRDLEDRISEIHLLADTGYIVDGCSGQTNDPGRRIASACEFSQETWAYRLNLERWSAAFQVSVLNPMTYLTGAVQYGGAAVLQSTSENICGTGAAPCRERLPFGSAGSHWLGNQRVLRWPDWRWQNHNGEEFFCTDPFGILLEQDRCSREEHGAILQRAAPLNWTGEPGQPWDRSSSSGASAATTLPLGAPGGN
jgi:hypothetical protein